MMTSPTDSTPLVTVIVPAYNAETFLKQTLLSIRGQTFPRLEIIVVDDGSTDGTRAIIDQQAREDPRIRLISVPNGGVARARNLGIEAAQATFLAFCDADDLWHPRKIELQIACLRERPDFAACYTLYRSINIHDDVNHAGPDHFAEGYILARHLSFHFVGNGSSLLVRRDAAMAVCGYDPGYADAGIGGCEDLDFEFKIAARFKIACTPLYLVGYRFHEGNMSSNRARMARSMLATTRRHLAANPTLPWQVRRHALAAAYNYVLSMSFQSRNYLGALAAVLWLLVLIPTRGLMVCANIVQRLLRWVGIVPKPRRVNSAEPSPFYSLDPRPPDAVPAGRRDRMRVLEQIDERLWRQLQQGQGQHASRFVEARPVQGGAWASVSD